MATQNKNPGLTLHLTTSVTRWGQLAQLAWQKMALHGTAPRYRRHCWVGSHPRAYIEAGVPEELAAQLTQGATPGMFVQSEHARRMCAKAGCPYFAHSDLTMKGFCCQACYKSAHGVPCDHFHGWRCERSRRADRCSQDAGFVVVRRLVEASARELEHICNVTWI